MASLIHSSLGFRGVIKLRRTMNEKPVNITNEATLSELYPDFVFRAKEMWLFRSPVDFNKDIFFECLLKKVMDTNLKLQCDT